jgi:hypothetical protein
MQKPEVPAGDAGDGGDGLGIGEIRVIEGQAELPPGVDNLFGADNV